MIGGRHTEGPRHVISHKAGSEKSIPWGFEFILWRRKALRLYLDSLKMTGKR